MNEIVTTQAEIVGSDSVPEAVMAELDSILQRLKEQGDITDFDITQEELDNDDDNEEVVSEIVVESDDDGDNE